MSTVWDLTKRPPDPPAYVSGLDLGTLADYSALATLMVETGPMKIDKFLGRTFKLGHLHRWDLRTAYADVVADVVRLFSRPPLSGTPLVVDRTGVGVAVFEQLARAKPNAHLVPVFIHGGKGTMCGEDGCWSVPKRELAGCLQVLLGTHRLKIVPSLPLAKVISRELASFKMKLNVATGHESFEALRNRDHDDLVLATALPCWYALRAQRQFWLRRCGVTLGDEPAVEESAAVGRVYTVPADPRPRGIDIRPDAPGWVRYR
jgi:hypothetical protein